ncbi:hypothetical protein EVAR_64548_1 [Eumeta japonica]|uniref:Uncharacterized protein n=1 Tax=Eumeta variegata TaxID=151549 RepID=A0A4C1ZUP1_EUMVA|nr:hypothetical protein EVAR_64548_1 [Eumeta japonica]
MSVFSFTFSRSSYRFSDILLVITVHWSPNGSQSIFVWVSLKWPVYDSEEIMSEDHLIPKVNDAAEKLRTEIRLGITTGEVRRKERARIGNRGGHFKTSDADAIRLAGL